MIVKIRISGTREECEAAVEEIGKVMTVRECSGFYVNRGSSRLGRVYLEVSIKEQK